MNMQLRRLSPISLSFGLTLLLAGSAWAAPPEDTDAADAGDAADATDAADAPDATAPEPEPEPAVAPETEAPAPTLTGDAPEPETETGANPEAGVAVEDPETDPKRPPPEVGDRHSIQYTSLLAPRVNPLGAEERLWIGYQYRLYSKNKAILNGSNIGLFFRPIVSPAIALVGATFQFQPAAVFRFRATYSYVAYFGTFQYFQSFKSPHDDFSETRLDQLADAGTNYKSTGHQIELEALIQARYKGLVLRSGTVANYNSMTLRDDDDLFYDVRIDALVPNNGWVLYNDTDLIWLQELKNERKSSIIAGGRATVVSPFYSKDVYEPGDEIDNPNAPQFRLGPEIGYIFYDRPNRRFNRPTLLLIPQWNIQHRWRTGRDVSSAVPTVALAFVFTGQLWGRN